MSPTKHRIGANGQAYTLEQLFALSRGRHNPQQVQQWWALMKPYVLRFNQGDRVLCNVGVRRIAGIIVSTEVEDPEDPAEIIPYVVKCDLLPDKNERRTISAPSDHDMVVCRERCFHIASELDFTKWAAPVVPLQRQMPLRFNVSDKVAIRVKDTPDGYEQWASGRVQQVWPTLPGPVTEGIQKTVGVVPYKVETDQFGAFYCHRDEHTLIRKPENVPRKLGKAISQRFEKRTNADGTVEKYDHVTLRGKPARDDSDDSNDEDD